MKKKNLIQKFKLPNAIIEILFSVSLIFLLSPYLSGFDLGIIKIPSFDNSIANMLKIIGPLISLSSIFFSIPIWPEKSESKETEYCQPNSSPINKNGKTEFSETKSDRLINDVIDTNLKSNNSIEKNITYFLKRNLKAEDVLYAKTTNSTYRISYAQNEYYKVSGGWFSRGGRSGYEVKIIGCVNNNDDNSSKKKVYKDYIASCKMCIKFGNGLITTPVKKITLRKINTN